MKNVTAGEVMALIDQLALREPNGAIAFDGDGTLWSGDVGEDFFEALIGHELHEASRDALAREASLENIDASGSGREIAHRIHAAYLAGTFPEERVCEIMTWAPAGWSRPELDRFCVGVIEKIDLKKRLHAEALRVIAHAREARIEVFLVSASPRAIVEQAARLVGIEQTQITAAREVLDANGIVQCAVERPIPYGPGKVTRLREKIGANRTLYAAFGDNAFDVSMLREARLPVAIRPKARLVERAGEVPGIMVLEREE